MLPHPLTYLINWGWLRIGPPYLYLNIDPIIFQIGPIAVRWYGLMYVIGILMGLFTIRGYVARKGISEDVLYRTLWWAIVAGIVGGRLYFVLQQHDLVQDYLLQPVNILATWKGGMAFYGAIFLVIPTVFWRARREGVNPLVLVDAAVLFAAAGQIFGRIGNIINGDVVGYPSTLPWSTVYLNPNSFSSLNIPVQPAAAYELLINLVLLGVMLFLAKRVTRPGILMLFYLFSYSISQFFLFFIRDNTIETPFGLDWGLKQAQWTSLVLVLILVPIAYWVFRTSKRVPADEVAATYGLAQPLKQEMVAYDTTPSEQPVDNRRETDDQSNTSNPEVSPIEVTAEPDTNGQDSIEDLHHDESGISGTEASQTEVTAEPDNNDSPGVESLPNDEPSALDSEALQIQVIAEPGDNDCPGIESLHNDKSDTAETQDIQLSPALEEAIHNALPADESQETGMQDIQLSSESSSVAEEPIQEGNGAALAGQDVARLKPLDDSELSPVLQDSSLDPHNPIAAKFDPDETTSDDNALETKQEEILVPVYAGAATEPEQNDPIAPSDSTAAILVETSSGSNAAKGRKSSSGKSNANGNSNKSRRGKK